MMNRLTNIAARQRHSRSRDLLFAGLVALAAVISITTVSTACHAATPAAHVAHR
jgi:hypothetical protein